MSRLSGGNGHNWKKSMWAAGHGVWQAWRSGRNMRIHFLAATLVLGMAFQVDLPSTIKAVLVLTVALVLSLEALNSAVESTVNLLTSEYHPLAKLAKDMAAGSVLLAAAASLAIAAIVAIDYQVQLRDAWAQLWQGPGWGQWIWIVAMLLQTVGILLWKEPV